jgi:glycine cleavage system H protein
MKWAVLPCSGMDKAEGSLAREVAIRVAESTGGEIVCPVLLNRAPARYKKTLSKNSLIVIDGCATRCASKLATQVEAKPGQRVLVSDAVKASGEPLEASLHLGPGAMALAEAIVDEVMSALSAPTALPETTVSWDAPAEFLVVVHDKYEFRIPKEGYWFNENDLWARVNGNRARVGISDYMQQRLTDISYFDPPEPGAVVEQFGELGSVESIKAVFEIISPVSGTVVVANQAVWDSPELINEDPFGAGWLVEVELADWQQDKELLLDGPAYGKTVERKADEE